MSIFCYHKSGDLLLYNQLLHIKDINHLPIIKFKGNTFNTTFYNTSGTFLFEIVSNIT